MATKAKKAKTRVQRPSSAPRAAVESELAEVGRRLGLARKRRRLSVRALAGRLGIDRRTIAALERGSGTVAMATFFDVLDALGLLGGMAQIVDPEHDLVAIAEAVRAVRRRGRGRAAIDDSKVDF